MRIVVGAAMSVPPFGAGMTWDRLHYVLGLTALGHETYYVEEVAANRTSTVAGEPCSYEQSHNRAHFTKTMERFGLTGRGCQLYNGGEAATGMDVASLKAAVAGADLLLNISGHVRSPFVVEAVRRRAYLDQDPVYTQLWDVEYGADLGLDQHEVLFTVGMNVGSSASPIPTGARTWHPTPPVIVVGHWPIEGSRPYRPFTTVATWGRYADLTHDGRTYASKREQFRRFSRLARLTAQPLEVALALPDRADADVRSLSDDGWAVTDASAINDPTDYRRYIAASRAEIGIAKGAYVTGVSGWVSERSCAYLATGRPVLAQSTGAEQHVPTGEGLLTFATLDEAVSGIDAINSNYEVHCRAARHLAESCFDHTKVLPALLDVALS